MSPAGKPKVQLQIVCYDGNNRTFQFVDKQGEEAQIKIRNNLKDMIAGLLPKFRRESDKALQDKTRFLSENPKMLQLYKDLVTSQIITSEEFWDAYGKKIGEPKEKDEVAVSASFLSEIKPVTDGCNGIRYNLTPEIIECIFKTYPSVKRIYAKKVPDKLSESDFWVQFFSSHYFHKDRIVSGFKDIFSECDRLDDIALKIAICKNLGDPLLDLTRFGDNTLEEDYCSSSANDGRVAEKSDNIVTQSIIKRFNHHSYMVLKTNLDKSNNEFNSIFEKDMMEKLSTAEPGKKKKKIPDNINVDKILDEIALTEEEMEEQRELKRKRIMEKVSYDDLMGESGTDNQTNGQSKIQLEKLERYLYGPMPSVQVRNGVANGIDYDEVERIVEENCDAIVTHNNILSSENAVLVLGELSPGGLLMKHLQDQNLSNFVPEEVEKDIRNLYIAGRELLKRFWTCFPISTPESFENASKVHECLHRYKIAKMKPFEEKLTKELAPLGGKLFHHLNDMFETAFSKFAVAAEKRNKNRKK